MKRGLASCVVALAVIIPAQAAAAAPQLPEGEIVFTSLRCDQGGEPGGTPVPTEPPSCWGSVFSVRADGTGLRRLTTSGEGRYLTLAAILPDGHVLVTSGNGNEHGYEVMNRDGSDRHPVTLPVQVHPVFRDAIAWSPRGDKIVYEDVTGSQSVADADGANQHRVIPDGMRTLHGLPPAFTADGRHIVFSGGHATTPHPLNAEDSVVTDWGSWMVDLDGSNLVRLTVGDIPGALTYGATFSPDGQRLALSAQTGGTPRGAVYTARIDGSELTKRTVLTGLDPVWIGPHMLVYGGTPSDAPPTLENGVAYGGVWNIWRVALDGAPPVPVTPPDGDDGRPLWNPAGGLAPVELPIDGSPPAISLPTTFAPSRKLRSGAVSARAEPLMFFAADPSGIRRIDAAVGLRARGGCRFLRKSKLGRRRRCDRPQYVRADNRVEWRKRTAHLPRGTYEVRFRTTDAKGHRTRHPRRRVVKLR